MVGQLTLDQPVVVRLHEGQNWPSGLKTLTAFFLTNKEHIDKTHDTIISVNAQDRKQLEQLAWLLLRSAEEEDSSIYGMSLLAKNQEQLEIFGPTQKKVEEILNTLIEDTQKHRKLLTRAAELLLKKLV